MPAHHRDQLRDPAQITGLWNGKDLDPKRLQVVADRGWRQVLSRLKVTLLVTREYEHLILALSSRGTTWFHAPHPSGLVADRKSGKVHVACTRNPNLLLELSGEDLLPTRARFLPGSLYLHDLALIGGELYGNAVGQDAVVRLDYGSGAKRVWWPRSIRGQGAFRTNHLQLNSIAPGKTLRDSFFSASAARPLPRRPGDPKFPVDRQGVLFSGRTREPIAWGLTRPHSARLHRGELWVDNSGYGEVGVVQDGRFEPRFSLGSWTRGLCFVQDTLFVGLSKVLPRFHAYAPGLDHRKSLCGLAALDPASGRELGRLIWPHGDQIFAIDWVQNGRFPFGGSADPRKIFYSFHSEHGFRPKQNRHVPVKP